MKKAVLAGLLVSSTMLLGSEYSPFIGLEVSATDAEVKSGSTTGDETGIGARAGFIADDHRIFISYSNVDELDLQMATLVLEGLTQPYTFTDWLATRAFAGGHLGAADVDGEVVDDTDVIYGVQGGFLLDFPANINLEIGYRYSWTEVQNVDNIQSLYGALNYQF